MSKLPQTLEQKEQDKRRKALQQMQNRISSAFCFKTIKTWKDVLGMEGMSESDMMQSNKCTILNLPITNADLKQHFETRKAELEQTFVVSPVVKIEPKVEAVSVATHNSDDDYGFEKSPKETAFLYWFQKKAVVEAVDGITKHNKRGQLILSSTGTGKTFMAGAIVRRLKDIEFAENKTYGAIQYLYVTRATIVEQTKRVFEKFFNLGIKDSVEVLNIEQLRSRAGAIWVDEKMEIISGQEVWKWEWKKMVNPVVVLWDECQALKNESSTQHKIAASFNDIKTPTYQLFISATPFTRVSEAKCFACSTRKNIKEKLGLLMDSYLGNQTWVSYASTIASPSKPDEYNEAAVERLTKDLEYYIIRVRGVRPQFDADNKIVMISFRTKEQEAFYNAAWERYLEEKAKLEAEGDGGSAKGVMMLVQFLKFRMAAELCRAPDLVERMRRAVDEGYAACCALNFKGTIIEMVKLLVDTYGVPRDKISLVWGGGQTQLTKKQKVKAQMKQKTDALKEAGLDMEEMMEAMDLEDVEDRVLQELPEHLKLGPQSQEERQKEIDRFQSGKSLFCFYTFRAGGVGLSLHHSDEFSPVKCRRKESGYAVEEDIPKVPIRPRYNFVAPTYSAMEMVQGLGRCPRLTSLSTTPQELIFYRGTIEEDVAAIVAQKLRCLARVVRMRESWQDVVVGGVNASEHIKNTEGAVDDPDALQGAGEENEE